MSKILLGEIIDDYIKDMKEIAPSYGIKSFSEQSDISRTFVRDVINGEYTTRSFSNRIIEGVAKAIKINTKDLKNILSSEDGKEIYYQRKELLNKIETWLQSSNNAKLEAYLSVINEIGKL